MILDMAKREKKQQFQCKQCGALIYRSKSRIYVPKRKSRHDSFCSMDCKQSYQKVNNIGYYRIITVDGKTIPEHRYIMQQHLCRTLEDFEQVHHINGDKRDNRIENLVVITASKHSQLHNPIGWDVDAVGEAVKRGLPTVVASKIIGVAQSSITNALARRGIRTKCRGGRPMHKGNCGAKNRDAIVKWLKSKLQR